MAHHDIVWSHGEADAWNREGMIRKSKQDDGQD
jgi:hypothetical protein